MSSTVVKAGKWLAKAALGGAGAWSWAIWLGAGAAITAAAVGWHTGEVADANKLARAAGAKEVQHQWDKAKLDKAYADNTALRESQREVSRLVTANQEIQRAYNQILGQLASADAARADAAGLRDAERAAIVAEAGRAAAGACARYAALSERHLKGVERDADQMGRLAVRATAKSEALERTLRERSAVRTRPSRADQPQPE